MTGGDHERRTLRLEIEYDGGGFAEGQIGGGGVVEALASGFRGGFAGE